MGILPFKAYIGLEALNFNHAAVFLNWRHERGAALS